MPSRLFSTVCYYASKYKFRDNSVLQVPIYPKKSPILNFSDPLKDQWESEEINVIIRFSMTAYSLTLIIIFQLLAYINIILFTLKRIDHKMLYKLRCLQFLYNIFWPRDRNWTEGFKIVFFMRTRWFEGFLWSCRFRTKNIIKNVKTFHFAEICWLYHSV